MNPEQFLVVAKSLVDNDAASSGASRSAVSRAYYFVFHSIRDLIEQELKIKVKGSAGGNEHKLLQDLLLNCNVNQAAQIGQKLANLHLERKKADYDLANDSQLSLGKARLCVERGEGIVVEARMCFAGPLKPKIIAGLTQYKKIRKL